MCARTSRWSILNATRANCAASRSFVTSAAGETARVSGTSPRRDEGRAQTLRRRVRGFERHGGVPEVLERHGRDVRGEQKARRKRARGVFFEGTERARRGDGEDVLDERGGARQTIAPVGSRRGEGDGRAISRVGGSGRRPPDRVRRGEAQAVREQASGVRRRRDERAQGRAAHVRARLGGHPRGRRRRLVASAPLLPEAVARERRRGETPRGSAPGVGGDTEERDAQPGSILGRGRLELGGRVVTRGGIETCDGIERDAEFLRVRCGGSSRLRLQSCRLGSGRGDDCGDVGSIRESHPCLDGDDARRGRSRGMRDRRTRSRRVSRNIKTLGWFPPNPRPGNYRSHCRNFRSRRGYRSRHSAAREAATQDRACPLTSRPHIVRSRASRSRASAPGLAYQTALKTLFSKVSRVRLTVCPRKTTTWCW